MCPSEGNELIPGPTINISTYLTVYNITEKVIIKANKTNKGQTDREHDSNTTGIQDYKPSLTAVAQGGRRICNIYIYICYNGCYASIVTFICVRLLRLDSNL